MAKPTTTTPAVYFQSLTVANVKCFHEAQTIDLSDGGDGFARWTVILGNNNTGKTTLLNALFDLDPSRSAPEQEESSVNIGKYYNNFFSRNYFALEFIKNLEKSFYIKSKMIKYADNIFTIAESQIGTQINNEIENGYNFKASFHNTDFKKSFLTFFNIKREIVYFENVTNNNDSTQVFINLYHMKDKNDKANKVYNKMFEILISGVLPDVFDLRIENEEISATDYFTYISCQTPYGWVPIFELGYGYQSMMGWVLDLVRRMMDRYPEAENPLAEPAIVLVDEIDLHLHPEWQRKIISHLTKHFPNTQFIVTAHSPLIVQSAEEVNVVLLKKDGDHVRIEQPKLRDYRGWSVEEILDDLMGLEDRVRSDRYLDLVHAFNTAIQDDSYASAIEAYEELMKILPEGSHLRQLFKIQLSDVNPV